MAGGVWRWPVTLGSSMSVDFDPMEVRFGDGYAQRVRRVSAAQKRSYKVRADHRRESEIMDMVAFLDALAGVDSFDFIPRDTGQPVRVRCKAYSVTYSGQTWGDLSAEFEIVREWP